MLNIKNNALYFKDLKICSGTVGDLGRTKYRLTFPEMFPLPDIRHQMSRNFLLPGDVCVYPKNGRFIVYQGGEHGYDLLDGSECWVPYTVVKVAT